MTHKTHKQTSKPQAPERHVPSIDPKDRVDEASYESFPASDPPAHTGTRARPSDKTEPSGLPEPEPRGSRH